MTREEAIKNLQEIIEEGWLISDFDKCTAIDACEMAIKALEQESCEMSVEEYRLRMIQALHNADCDELIVVCVMPTEKEFEHLEWWLKNNYKKEPCEDCISRQSVINAIANTCFWLSNDNWKELTKCINSISPVTPQPKSGKWENISDGIEYDWGTCNKCKTRIPMAYKYYEFCPNCGIKMEQESK